MNYHFILLLLTIILFGWGCSDDENLIIVDPPTPDQVIILNEGKFGTPSGGIALYNKRTQSIVLDAFITANGRPMGDTFQSMNLIGDKYYAVLQTSDFIEILDTADFSSLGRITNMRVPRYLAAIDEEIGYVTSGFNNDKIYKISLTNSEVISEMDLPGVTNQMVYQNGLLAIAAENGVYVLDPIDDTFVDTLLVGHGATDMAVDINGDIWVSCAGQSWPPEIPASLYKINIGSRSSEEIVAFSGFGTSSHLDMNGIRDTLFIINDHVYKISISNPSELIRIYSTPDGSSLYGLGVDPNNSDVYIADAIDFVQNGRVNRLSSDGQSIDSFSVGLLPNGFIFPK